MSDKINNGGPAANMSLRDHFAGLALQVVASTESANDLEFGEMALAAYAIADAMIKARGESKQQEESEASTQADPDDKMAWSIRKLDLKRNTYWRLRAGQIETIGELCSLSEYELSQFYLPRSQKYYDEIKGKLAVHGLKLREETKAV